MINLAGQCTNLSECPSVQYDPDRGRLIIVGQKLVGIKVGWDEAAIELPVELFLEAAEKLADHG